jgi:HD superfamily phosphohydrolase
MERLNNEWDNQLEVCLSIFKDEYPKHFLHQLVSGQLDVDRLDYLRRDSFFTGVSEGNIGSARIIKMLDVRNDKLVVESKGIYSIENFLMSRRLMYWQVYLHKTAVAAEKTMINTLMRAKELSKNGVSLFASPALSYFLKKDANEDDFREDSETLNLFLDLDDNDIWSALKVWSTHQDVVLSTLSNALINRRLFKISISPHPHDSQKIDEYVKKLMRHFKISREEAHYLVSANIISTDMYSESDDSIDIVYRDGTIKDISEASDMLNIELLSKKVEKYYFAYYKID